MSIVPTTYIDWHCAACGHEHEARAYGGPIPVTCPQCGVTNKARRGYPILPTNEAWCDDRPRQYSISFGGEKEIQVYLRAATGEKIGHTMNPDWVPDCGDDPIAVARAVLAICKDRYIYCGSTPHVEKVLAAMEACQELSEANRRANRIHELRRQIVLGLAEYEDLVAEPEEEER